MLDTIKKHVIYDQQLDRDNIIEELGDIEFYLSQLRQALCISREETLHHNYVKLSKRYPDQSYTDQHAYDRLDKADN
jgi:NTP pyrophosphatase (non-canonical NTP hydrolase)